jgi:hypothetical protein
MPKFTLKENEKLSIVAIENAYTDLPENCQEQLSDGTWVLGRIPVDIEALWKEWLGSIRLDKTQESNVVLVRAAPSGHYQNPAGAGLRHMGPSKNVVQNESRFEKSPSRGR